LKERETVLGSASHELDLLRMSRRETCRLAAVHLVEDVAAEVFELIDRERDRIEDDRSVASLETFRVVVSLV